MNIYVFTGPTISPRDARQELDAIFLPPASEGDVYRAACNRPIAIGIIDGYFESVPSVWHKEILWAMNRGIHVLGSASMGALRAAELTAFGMEGVGRVYEAFRDGLLEDDDEVAVAHMDERHDYVPISVAMVNIRATLTIAEQESIISPTTRRSLESIAKAIYYQERSYDQVLQLGCHHGLPKSELEALATWLPSKQVDQKHKDAIAMLRLMQSRFSNQASPKQVSYWFEATDAWNEARRLAGRMILNSQSSDVLRPEYLVDELRLRPESYALALEGALARYLALEESWRHGFSPAPDDTQAAAERLLSASGLSWHDLSSWLRQNNLNTSEFWEFAEDEARLAWVRDFTDEITLAHLPDYLRSKGQYASLAGRAADKQARLRAQEQDNLSLADIGISENQLFCWYFTGILKRPVPADLVSFSQAVGFENIAAFKQWLLREYCYSNSTHAPDSSK